jgi:hypothetical protein
VIAVQQSEYQRGVSAWHFDIEDLKAQALLVKRLLTSPIQSLGYSGYDITLPSNPELMQIHDDDPPEIKENDDRTIEVEKVCLI